ncbi:MAG: hypothetical protein GX666_04840 [Tissierellia bacterium]|nr:hypothetical protein [Tissierellia bacterium]
MEAFAKRIIFEEEILYWIIFYGFSSLVLFGALDSHVLKDKDEKTKALKIGIVSVNLIFLYLLRTPNVIGTLKAKLIFVLICFLWVDMFLADFGRFIKIMGRSAFIYLL